MTGSGKPWGSLPGDAEDPNFGRVCIQCDMPVRAGERYAHVCSNPTNPAGIELGRVRDRLRALRGLLDGLELTINDPKPPGPNAAQGMAHAAVDLAVYVGRLDAVRRTK